MHDIAARNDLLLSTALKNTIIETCYMFGLWLCVNEHYLASSQARLVMALGSVGRPSWSITPPEKDANDEHGDLDLNRLRLT